MRDDEITLGEGRLVTYSELGDPRAPAVFYFHGAPSSRLDLVGLDHELSQAGVRLVSPDRPGYGGSSPVPGRRLSDWPLTVASLADRLGIDRFAVIGFSSGGPYAVACAAGLPGRIVGAGVVSGVTDFGWPGAWDGYAEAELMRTGDEAAVLAACEQMFGRDGSGFLEAFPDMAAADEEFMDQPAGAAFMATFAESLRQGMVGYAQDLAVEAQPWTFDPGAIRGPVRILHGDADTLVPLAHPNHTSELIPTSALEVRQGQGHVSLLTEIPRLARDLIAPLTRPS